MTRSRISRVGPEEQILGWVATFLVVMPVAFYLAGIDVIASELILVLVVLGSRLAAFADAKIGRVVMNDLAGSRRTKILLSIAIAALALRSAASNPNDGPTTLYVVIEGYLPSYGMVACVILHLLTILAIVTYKKPSNSPSRSGYKDP
jgi:hypothetical protein